MPRQRTYRTRAIILKSKKLGEADRVLTVFTPDIGKKTLMAKGVRKTASRKAGHLEPFTLVSLFLAKARTWDIITHAQAVNSFQGLREDLDKMAHAYYFTELVDAFTKEEDKQRPVFDLLLFGLERVQDSESLALVARWFELRLLRLTGYQPQLFHCIDCGKKVEPVMNYFSQEDGGVLCPDHGAGRRGVEPLEVGTLKVLRYLQSQPFATVSNLHLTDNRHRQLERLLANNLRHILERRLRSPNFIRKLQG